MTARFLLYVWILVTSLVPAAPAVANEEDTIGIEYIAHASFVIESSSGTRVVVDPYNNDIWIGYRFPDDPPDVDAVLITHPHYDHDASYYFPAEVPVFRRPGRYAVGDIRFEGVRGRHCDPYGKEFGQTNTIWIVELDGLRIVHLGDNGPLDDDLAAALGKVDILMIPGDATYHILKKNEVDDILRRLRPRVTVPMHYLLPSLVDEVKGLGPIEPWLEGRERSKGGRDSVLRLDGHTTRLDPTDLPPHGSFLVFRPSPAVEAWDAPFQEARKILSALGDDTDGAEKVARLRRALELVPASTQIASRLARQLDEEGKTQEAVHVLERALAGAGRDDWAVTGYARWGLVRLYQKTDKIKLAERQCRLILASSHQLRLREMAEGCLRPTQD